MKKADQYFIPALLIGMLFTLFIPWLRISALIPPIVMLFYRRSKYEVLWTAIAIGIFLDLLAQQTRFGIYALDYVLTTLIIWERRKLLFEDSIWTYPALTALFASISTALMLPIRLWLDRPLPFDFWFVCTDLILMPLYDGVYCFLIILSLILAATQTDKKRPWRLKRPK